MESDNTHVVREFERRIDDYPSSLRIFTHSLEEVQWHLLLAHEHELYNRQCAHSSDYSLYDAEDLKKSLKHALNWANEYCHKSGDSERPNLSITMYADAIELLMLGSAYQPIFCMFSMMNNRRKLVSGSVDSAGTLHLEYDPRQLQYEALHFLTVDRYSCDLRESLSEQSDLVAQMRCAIHSVLETCELTSVNELKYSLSETEYGSIKAIVEKSAPGMFRLPDDWRFRGISSVEYRTVFNAARVLSLVHSVVHSKFVNDRRREDGSYPILDSAVWRSSKQQLAEQIHRFEENLRPFIAEKIIDLLTYEPATSKPDPALQPIIPSGETFLIAPQLLMNGSFERNLVALLAREYKDEYDRTTSVLEPSILSEIETALRTRGFSVNSNVRIPGNPSLPDIDILAYEPNLREMILAEVKWVIPPGEPYEQLSRADAEERAITKQLRPLVEFAASNKAAVMELLDHQEKEIDKVSIRGCLIMRGFCGMHHELVTQFPTLDADLLLREINSPKSNESLLNWIMHREFLPEPDRDYSVRDLEFEYGPNRIVIRGASLTEK